MTIACTLGNRQAAAWCGRSIELSERLHTPSMSGARWTPDPELISPKRCIFGKETETRWYGVTILINNG